jgi:hypothetical protein
MCYFSAGAPPHAGRRARTRHGRFHEADRSLQCCTHRRCGGARGTRRLERIGYRTNHHGVCRRRWLGCPSMDACGCRDSAPATASPAWTSRWWPWTGRRRWPAGGRASCPWRSGSGHSSAAPASAAGLQADGNQHDALERNARSSDGDRHASQLQGLGRSVHVGRLQELTKSQNGTRVTGSRARDPVFCHLLPSPRDRRFNKPSRVTAIETPSGHSASRCCPGRPQTGLPFE